MGKYDAMRQLLHDAYMLKAIEDLAEIPPDEEIDKIHQFSPEFKQRMADMMNECFGCRNKAELAAARKRHLETVKKFATAAAVSMAFTFSCAMSVEAIRESFVKFVVRIYDDFLKVSLPPKDDTKITLLPQIIETYYEPTWLPDNYIEIKREKYKDRFLVKYQNNDMQVVFLQIPIAGNGDSILDYDLENGVVEQISECATYSYANGSHQLFWSDDTYYYLVRCSSSKEELLRISQSLQPNNTMLISTSDYDKIETYCIPHWQPESFALREIDQMPGYNFRRYTNGNQEYTFLQCKSVDYMVSALADYDLSKYALELIPDVGRFQYAPGRPSLLSWKDDTYFYLLTGNLSQEDFAELAKSVKPE